MLLKIIAWLHATVLHTLPIQGAVSISDVQQLKIV